MKKSKKKSPLKAAPLRYSGQSINEEIDQLLNEKAILYLFTSALLPALTLHEWYRWHRELPPSPLALSILTILIVPFCFYKLFQIRNKIKHLKLGKEGEQVVGEYLEALREKGYRVFHDIQGEGFNLDHVIISPYGIFNVETKTRSKPKDYDAQITFDGEKVLVDGRELDRDPLTQAKAGQKWLEELLKETTGKNYPVRSVIVFPGWFIKSIGNAFKCDTWVLNPKALPAFIEKLPESVSLTDMSLAAFHLSRFIRTS